jgi:hypothetical protein
VTFAVVLWPWFALGLLVESEMPKSVAVVAKDTVVV